MTWARGHTHRFTCREGKPRLNSWAETVNILKGVWGGRWTLRQSTPSESSVFVCPLRVSSQVWICFHKSSWAWKHLWALFLVWLRNWMMLPNSYLGWMWWFWTAESSLAQFVAAFMHIKVKSGDSFSHPVLLFVEHELYITQNSAFKYNLIDWVAMCFCLFVFYLEDNCFLGLTGNAKFGHYRTVKVFESPHLSNKHLTFALQK